MTRYSGPVRGIRYASAVNFRIPGPIYPQQSNKLRLLLVFHCVKGEIFFTIGASVTAVETTFQFSCYANVIRGPSKETLL